MTTRTIIRFATVFPLALCLLVAVTASLGAEPNQNNPYPRLGINLAGPADWNTELPFVDVFRLSRTWISQKQGESWGRGPKLQLDEHGWVQSLDEDCWAETPLCTIDSGRFPGGQYTVLYDGSGRIEFSGRAKVVARKPGQLQVQVDPARGGFFLQIRETSPDDYIRNIRVIMPGFESTYQDNPWHPAFLERWKDVACLRYMDFMHTNNSKVTTWSERPKLTDATFTTSGIPLELLVDLANRLKIDPWFCIPHRADDEFVRNFAQLVHEQLDPSLQAYIEYSNEVWNSQFEQHRYAAEQGQKLKLADKPWEAAWFYTAHRSLEIFAIWEEVFSSSDRLVRVLPSQAANVYISQQITGYRDAAQRADVLAIAPYLSFNISPQGEPSAATVATWTADQVLDHLEKHALPECTRWMEENRKVAEKHGLKLVAYEAGQHMVGIQGAENNEALTKLLISANAHPRMESIYQKYLQAWEDSGGDLLCYFSSVSEWSKWGSWGLLQYYDEDPAKSPKARAVLEWAKSHP